jgi:hypothetical protein
MKKYSLYDGDAPGTSGCFATNSHIQTLMLLPILYYSWYLSHKAHPLLIIPSTQKFFELNSRHIIHPLCSTSNYPIMRVTSSVVSLAITCAVLGVSAVPIE